MTKGRAGKRRVYKWTSKNINGPPWTGVLICFLSVIVLPQHPVYSLWDGTFGWTGVAMRHMTGPLWRIGLALKILNTAGPARRAWQNTDPNKNQACYLFIGPKNNSLEVWVKYIPPVIQEFRGFRLACQKLSLAMVSNIQCLFEDDWGNG